VGPVSSTQLKALAVAGSLLPTDRVLKVGSQKWARAGDVKHLFPLTPAEARSLHCDPFTEAAHFLTRHEALSEAHVVPEAGRCIQCGICSYNCPIGIDVRSHARRSQPIHDSHCLTCSQCVNRCPRGVLRFERLPLFTVQ
jgi:ferredoxin